MNDILPSVKYVVDNSRKVKIIFNKINELVSKVDKDDLKISELNLSKYRWSFETLVQIIFVFNTINYCYWAKKGKGKWTVEFEGVKLDGAIALFRCIEEEVKRNSDFLCGDELADLSRINLKRILKGNVQIPLFEERLKCLNEVGKILEKKFENSFFSIYKQSENDAIKMVSLLIANFPNVRDESNFKGKIAAFYKRAQLNSRMISDLLIANGKKELNNLDKLSAFADYKIPQKLRSLGILEYTNDLANKIDNFELIEANSEDEVEIRANMIWGIELIRIQLLKKYPFATSSHIDSMLWNMSQTKKEGEKPYHRTLTTAY